MFFRVGAVFIEYSILQVKLHAVCSLSHYTACSMQFTASKTARCSTKNTMFYIPHHPWNVCLLCLPNSPSFTTDSILDKTKFEFDVLPMLMENLSFYKSYNSGDENQLTPGSFFQITLKNQDTDRDPILIMLDEIDVSTYTKRQTYHPKRQT